MINNKWIVHVENGEEYDTITIQRPHTAPRAATCVSRTKEGGTVARVMTVKVNMDTLETVKEEVVMSFPGKPDTEDMEKQARAKGYAAAKILNCDYKDGGVVGIPRYVFNDIAVSIERPVSQQ